MWPFYWSCCHEGHEARPEGALENDGVVCCAAPLARLIMTLGVFDDHGPEGQEGAGDEN